MIGHIFVAFSEKLNFSNTIIVYASYLTEMLLTYRNLNATSYRLLPHCAEGGVGSFFSLLSGASSTLQGGIELHARYNLTLSPFIYSYSPDLMQILYLFF